MKRTDNNNRSLPPSSRTPAGAAPTSNSTNQNGDWRSTVQIQSHRMGGDAPAAAAAIATDEFGFPMSLPAAAAAASSSASMQQQQRQWHEPRTTPVHHTHTTDMKMLMLDSKSNLHQEQQQQRLPPPQQRQQSSTPSHPKMNHDFIHQYTSSSNTSSSQRHHNITSSTTTSQLLRLGNHHHGAPSSSSSSSSSPTTLAAMTMRQVAPPNMILSNTGYSSISSSTSANKSRTTIAPITTTNTTNSSRSKLTITSSSSTNNIKDNKKKYMKYTFQHPANAMRLSVRTVDLSRRVAFDRQRILRPSVSSSLSTSSATATAAAADDELLHSSYSSIVSSQSLRRMVEEMNRVRTIRRGGDGGGGGDGNSSIHGVGNAVSNLNGNPCRISPSPNHMAILEFMHGLTTTTSSSIRPRVIRQLRWNVACSEDADPWFDGTYYEEDNGDEEAEEYEDNDGNSRAGKTSNNSNSKRGADLTMRNISLDENKAGLTAAAAAARPPAPPMASAMPRRRKPSRGRNDGRYIPIDALASVRSSIPNHSPILTNVKRRLPTRSDVGFARPSPEEINSKMDEVRKEAEWEEASPRLVLLASGFMLFDEKKNGQGEDNPDMVDRVHPSCKEDLMLWAGGAIPGVPFAGRDLVKSYKRAMSSTASCRSPGIDMDQFHAKNPRTYSIFAPPVDAIYSSTQLWRPRPFMDRPPGQIYFLACPLDVRLDKGDTEAFFCTMSLYSLPPVQKKAIIDVSSVPNNSTTTLADCIFRGKISEDFFFPAGDWSTMEGLKGDGLECIEGSRQFDYHDNEEPPQQSWRRRKRRAIMSYDPLDVSLDSLHLVIQVFRASRPKNASDSEKNPSVDHTNGSNDSKRGIFSGKLLPTMAKSRQKAQSSVEHVNNKAFGSLEEVGAQYLVPVCFGVTPVFPVCNISEQKVEKTAVYSFPDASLSNDEFVKLLTSILSPEFLPKVKHTPTICGSVDLFTSYLGRDFTRALLDEPPQLINNYCDDVASAGPQLLADVMGECAISFDGLELGDGKKMRSSLRRLPLSQESGYSSSFDLKEVLYFPPRSMPRKYDDDTAFSASTIINLLYVYPCLIRWDSSQSSKKYQSNDRDRFSIRIQVVEQELPFDQQSFDGIDPTYQALQSIYNPSSPAGPPLVEAYFTKVFKIQSDDTIDHSTKTNRKDTPLRDEIKIRLPDILDRRHFIQFTLFVMHHDGNIEKISETSIPFIISSKESTSGTRVTTVIPNGLHRIRLSEVIQIHVETRLASSFHVSDPSVATLLRDYPLISSSKSSGVSEHSGMDTSNAASDVIVHSSSGLPFLDIFASASGNAVKRHFLSLVHTHLINFVNQKCPPYYFESVFDMFGRGDSSWHRLVPWETTDRLLAIIRGLFEILDKARTSYQERDHLILSMHYLRLVKSFLDNFDEVIFAHHDSIEAQHSDICDNSTRDSIDSSNAYDDDDFFYAPLDALKESKDLKRSPRYTVASPRNNIQPKPFSRRAFVASRNEEIKAESELELNKDRDYFDDDETVMTLSTYTSRMDSGSVFPVIPETESIPVRDHNELHKSHSSKSDIQEDTSTGWGCGSAIPTQRTRRRSPVQIKSSTPFSFAAKRAEDMANRVNNMAQMMIAPCIAPPVDEMVTDGSLCDPIPTGNGAVRYGKNRASSEMIALNGNAIIQSPFEPSSDAEEEGETKCVPPYLRGNQSCFKVSPLVFQPMKECDELNLNHSASSSRPFLYELVSVVWVQAWTSAAASMKSDAQFQGSSSFVSHWPHELVLGGHNSNSDAVLAFSFVRNVSFFLPLCLKSLGLRCANSNKFKLTVPTTLLDSNHIQVLIALFETIALGLMRQALSGSSGFANSDQMLTKSLMDCDFAMDFLVGIFSVLHPSQCATLVLAYFNVLEECSAIKSNTRMSKCASQIRLHAVERLSAMPSFARLNFPIMFTGSYPRTKVANNYTWANQCSPISLGESVIQKDLNSVQRFPHTFWLSTFLIHQCFSICENSCALLIFEAKNQAKALKMGRQGGNSGPSRCDLHRIESLAFHSILIAYEMLIKRQAMDSRFQTVTSSTRVAAMFTRSVLQQTVGAVVVLARMDPNHKVRLLWILSLLFVLQEGPDALIRDELRMFCKDNRIFDFVSILKLASSTCQHFIPNRESLPVLGGLSKEMTQEAFNCISASIILLIDECFDVVSRDMYGIEKLGRYLFDLMLHLLATPQSSVTHLRTLGGTAHALDKFGVIIFLKAIDTSLQHWGRIVLTMMNSTELSVRSMAVDFLVSLLAGVFHEFGSIDQISLVFLTVLPEIAAREIALCSVSGLITSMENVEASLWPLRRALADVEETNPLDDDRIDPQLLPSLTTLCRTGQAIIDSVLVEIRLRYSSELNLGEIAKSQFSAPLVTRYRQVNSLPADAVFDADEESVLEAASFFSYESSLPQKLRWLFTLRDVHVAKGQWAEVAQVLIICAESLIKSVDHLQTCWQPSRFDLWNDYHLSPWISAVGLQCSRGNNVVMDFAHSFLEPNIIIQERGQTTPKYLLTVESVCSTLTSVIDQIEFAYAEEGGLEDLACFQMEQLLTMVTSIISAESNGPRAKSIAALRRARASICLKLAKFSEVGISLERERDRGAQIYIRIVLYGNKPCRFQESTAIPTSFEWGMPSICRVSKRTLVGAARMKQADPANSWEECICRTYARPLIEALRNVDRERTIVLVTGGAHHETAGMTADETKTYISVAVIQKKGTIKSRRFFVRNSRNNVTEYAVAHRFPHCSSRQRSLITSVIKSAGQQ